MEEKKNFGKKITGALSKLRFNFKDQVSQIQNGGKSLVITVIVAFIIMILAFLAVFFLTVQGAEKVMVPNVVGKNLTNALLDLQSKELYGKIQLRYSDLPGDQGTILEQSPDAGAIVKAYRRVTLTVSRGVAIDELADYTGENIDDIKKKLDVLFSGEHPLVIVAQPVFVRDDSAEGTIIAQYPEAGTPIVDPVKVQFVVSSGSMIETVKVPSVAGLNIKQVLEAMAQNKITFDFTSHIAAENEKAGTVTNQDKVSGDEAPAFTRLNAEFALSPKSADSDIVQGIFEYDLPEYPYAVPVQLDAISSDGKVSTLISFNHPGQKLTIPYEVKKGTTLRLYVLGTETQNLSIN